MQQEWRAARDAGAALRGACRAARWAAVAARLLFARLAVGLLLEDGSTALSLQRAQGTDDIVVVLPAGVSTASVLRDLDIRPTYRYEHVFEGFAAEVPREVRQALEQIPGVIVSPNRRVEAAKNSKNNKKHSHLPNK